MKIGTTAGLGLGIFLALNAWAGQPPEKGAAPKGEQGERAKANQAMRNGNYKDALEVFQKLALAAETDPVLVATDLSNSVQCLRSLGRNDEMDALLEKAIKVHEKNWRVLFAAARAYSESEHYGQIIGGEFSRGHRRGGGQAAFVFERDRVRALQLLEQALPVVAGEKDRQAAYDAYMLAAQLVLRGPGYGYWYSDLFREAWRLQYLTDLKQLPDYEEYRGYGYGDARGAPVNPDGSPVLHALAKTWAEAKTDGERWRWLLIQAQEAVPARTGDVLMQYGNFLHSQFGVQTMAYAEWFGRGGDETAAETGPYAVRSLGEDETIAKLATGIKRFKLPDEYNPIKVFMRAAEEAKTAQVRRDANSALGRLFEDRQQYARAAEFWEKAGEPDRVRQIRGNWGQFEQVLTQPAGEAAAIQFRFRNGKKASFEAFAIDTQKLLQDAIDFIKTKPGQIPWERMEISNLGANLVEGAQKKYVGAQAAAWDLALEPRAGHFDKRITVATPLKKPGAYLLISRMENGNVNRVVVWVSDTVIVKKPLVGQAYYFVADAITGQPIANASLNLFGYRQEYKGGRRYDILTQELTGATDADGQFLQKADPSNKSYQWVVTATTKEGRFAYLGWTGVWNAQWYDQEYNQTKSFCITDRPVYRPGQTVKYKFWVGQAKYDLEGNSPLAGQQFSIQINNPKGEKVFNQSHAADRWGGFDGEYVLPKDATLGNYGISDQRFGGGHFRVEEYKKPEFEVKIDAPAEPVMLGEKVPATITAKYYFGAPVAEGRIKYKVLRYSHTAQWYPPMYWDWYYGPGYWWFAYDYDWYPGWKGWGFCCPRRWWWHWREPRPEIVMENEGPIAPDGTVKIEVDTGLAKAVMGHTDHRYEISAEVTDLSRRTIVGQGSVLVARKPFKVYAWVDRGHYRVGDSVEASFSAQTLDNKPVTGSGVLRLLKIAYDKDGKPVETEVQKWNLAPNPEGRARQQIKASQAGQYRLSYTLKDVKGHEIEGGYVFCIAGQGFDSSQFRFNDLELVADQSEYKPQQNLRLMINTNRAGGTVVLFPRPANGVCREAKVIRLKGKSAIEEIQVAKKDMPNFFVEAFTVADGKVHQEMREIIVPPEDRVLKVEAVTDSKQYKPGQKAKVKLTLTELNGEPYSGAAVLTMYDKAVEYISGGSNVPEIKSFFWKWRRTHRPTQEHSFLRGGYPFYIHRIGERGMEYLGVFGRMLVDAEEADQLGGAEAKGGFGGRSGGGEMRRAAKPANGLAMDRAEAPGEPSAEMAAAPAATAALGKARAEGADEETGGPAGAPGSLAEPTVRTKFADTAFWAGNITTNLNGCAEFEITMPENLTTWKVKTWAMATGTRVGQAETEVLTTKNLILRLQAPRFFVEKDEVVLSANVHNYLPTKKTVKVTLESDGPCLTPTQGPQPAPGAAWNQTHTVEIEPKGEKRVDWRVRVAAEGQAIVRMKALTDEESDAMEMRFPAYVHGMLKMDSYCGSLRPSQDSAVLTVNVPAARRPEMTRLEARYSPTLAGAMVDALPYMVDYPYGCTEQTLNRFLPTVVTQNVLLRMNLNLKDIRDKLTNLNAQELGAAPERAAQWKRYARNPVFDKAEVAEMTTAGVNRLRNMQCGDGGWGWFSGHGEYPTPHMTALVVHGLQIARANGVQLPGGMVERGVEWLKRHQAQEVRELKNAPTKTRPWKDSADNQDALTYMVLADAGQNSLEMRDFLYRDRNNLSVYAKAMFGLALHKIGDKEKRDMLIQNVDQFLVQDNENQTAYLRLPEGNYWWYWYGSESEANAYYLKLLAATDPKGEKAARLVKYVLNNRKHASYWNSTRDTAVSIEALADFLTASGEDRPDMTVQVLLNGKNVKDVEINESNLFTFDNALVLEGPRVEAGAHKIEFRRKGKGPLYFNTYLTNFTLEDHIAKAGLEIKVDRKYYKLKRVEAVQKAAGERGQVLDQKVEKYERIPLANQGQLTSGDLVEIELEIESKNDYEYIVFEDMKAAGFEPVDVRSGYSRNALNAYMELRDERVCFFVRALPRGRHSVSYRMRAEIPGLFSALPTRASAMYAPELKANSEEIKLRIAD